MEFLKSDKTFQSRLGGKANASEREDKSGSESVSQNIVYSPVHSNGTSGSGSISVPSE
jgi:hypothetical protein